MKFVSSQRYSPVVYEKDVPHDRDLYWVDPETIPTKIKTHEAFIRMYRTDKGWWERQRKRCIEGYTVKKGVIWEGGDVLKDGVNCFVQPDGSRKIPHLGIIITPNEEDPRYGDVYITGKHYFYLNFWKIMREDKFLGRKILANPFFTDLSFENWHIRQRMITEAKDNGWFKARQKGMEQPNSELVFTGDGWKTMGELKVGDKVYTRKGTLSSITHIFPQGKKDVYELKLLDGRTVKCGENHLWSVWDRKAKPKSSNNNGLNRILKTSELIEKGILYSISKSKNTGYRFCLPDIEPIPFSTIELPIDPYLLGVLLGDGTMNKGLKIASMDQELLDKVQSILGDDYYLHHDKSGCNYTLSHKNVFNKKNHEKYGICGNLKLNPIREELKILGLQKKCEDKFIPEIYKYSSIKQRLELIRGLMDTDGHISPNGCMEFKNCSPRLVSDLASILRSLGIKCKVSEFESNQGYKNFFRLYLSSTRFNPFSLSRKAKLFNPKKEIYKRSPIVSIEKLDYQEESSCILIDDVEHIYLTRDFIPTHNSEEEGADSAYDFLFYNDIQIAIVGGLEVYNENTYKMLKRGVYQLYNTQFFKTIDKDNAEIFSTLHTGTEVHSRTAKNNSQILSGLNSLYKAHLEEIGIMREKLARDIAEFIKPSIKVGRNRTGYITYTGTSGEFKDGVADIEKMIYSPGNYDLLQFENIYDPDTEPGTMIACYIPAWKFKIQDEDGNSLKSESIEFIEQQRAEAKPEERAIKIAAEPITTNEMFNITTGGFFGDMILFHCNTARSHIVTHKSKQIIERGFLHYKNSRNPIEGVEWEPNNDYGDIFVAEKPQRDREGNPIPGLYGIGTDSYDFTTANTSSSKLSSLVYKTYNDTLPYGEGGIHNNFVAMYLDRPSEAQGGRHKAYDNSAKLTIWYQGYNLIEYSKILIFEHFVLKGLEGYLKLRPDFAIANMVDRSEVSNRYGYPASLVPQGLKVLKDWLSNHDNIYNCPFVELLSAWAKFKIAKDYNCDNTISSMLCVVAADNDLIELQKPDRDTNAKVLKAFKGYREINGILQSIYA